MNDENPNPDDAKLSALLRSSRAAPALPPQIVAKTQAKYIEAYTRLTGSVL